MILYPDSFIYPVRIQGEWACFTRPELKTERVSYHVITPSAARGAIEAVLWKPAIRWIVRRIFVLNPIRFVSIKRNEVCTVVPVSKIRQAMKGLEIDDYFADEDRAQRNSVILKNVDYIVEIGFSLTDKAGPDDNCLKFDDMFMRRLEKGQYHTPPYLGCREYPAVVSPGWGFEFQPLDIDLDLGFMLKDIAYGAQNKAEFFHAKMIKGVINVIDSIRQNDGGEAA